MPFCCLKLECGRVLKTAFGLFIFLVSCCVQAASPFLEAKKQARVIWSEHRETLYCHCPYDKHGKVLYHRCDYQPPDIRRAKRIEWEHIVPVSWFGKGRECWESSVCTTKKGKRYKGRDCCENTDPEFVQMYTDLHNLVPVIGSINQARRAYRFSESTQVVKDNPYAVCECIINQSNKTMTPSDRDKGLIARVVLYMEYQYGVRLTEADKLMYLAWNQAHPPSEWEQRWNLRVMDYQKRDNPFVSCYPNIPVSPVSP